MSLTRQALLNRRAFVISAAACGLIVPATRAQARGDTIGDEILLRINTLRSDAGLETLKANRKLDKAARKHAQAMAREGTLTHVIGASDPTRRARQQDYRFSALAENIGLWPAATRDADTATALVAAWRASPDHAANLLNQRYVHSGIGADIRDNTVYAVQMFAKPK